MRPTHQRPLRLLTSLIVLWTTWAMAQTDIKKTYPFSTDTQSLTAWNGQQYAPITLKGINMGVAVPGTFPSELNVTYELYYTWFGMIREAGFNTIRLYTLHYPQFYKALRDYNQANPQTPLLVIQGVWLEEELDGYTHDLYGLTDVFKKEIQDNVGCVHGNNTIGFRLGKAYGIYTADISQWMLGYIIGREVHPTEVIATNQAHPGRTGYTGQYLSIQNVAAAEVFVTSMMDHLLQYEMTAYQTQRPLSFSSWPTLDPLNHPTETQTDEDIASINISGIDFSNAKAGVFASYHAYPYYPDFISKEPGYTTYSDHWGQNSYLGYLTALKAHYPTMPLIIGEFGVPSSWGIAHYAHSGMNHGGFDERQQGENNIRLFDNILEAGCGGGIMFAWIDEWFKRTWITDPMDFLADRRILWQNITAAEQNFGLLGFTKSDGSYANWGETCDNCAITQLQAKADFAFFSMKVATAQPFDIDDTLWVAIDTYDASLGESLLPNGKTVSNRAEFALMATADKAELYVTQAYDLYGIWHKVSSAEQLYHSVATNGKPWKLVRWKNNQTDQEVQFIGSLKVNRLNLPSSSTDAVTITGSSVEIRLPWTLLNFVDPSTCKVMHDDRSTSERELAVSDGIAVSVFLKNQVYTPAQRFLWETWNHALNTQSYIKQSYQIVKSQLPNYPGALVAHADSFEVLSGQNLVVGTQQGLFANDMNYDGGASTVIITENPKQGLLFANADGSFAYTPDYGFSGQDNFRYRFISGANSSNTTPVTLNVTGNPGGDGFVDIYPNPSSGIFTFSSRIIVDAIEVYNVHGIKVVLQKPGSTSGTIDLARMPKGHYFARFISGADNIVKKLVVQ
ncbi:MAG: T9SS type A sorting domain-containing protein [Breznakibacter sp.]